MITLFGCAHFFNCVSFLLYPTKVKRLKCTMLGPSPYMLLLPPNYQVSKEVVNELEFGDVAVMQI